jgi:energy-converting hydrogenase Eha subunit A
MSDDRQTSLEYILIISLLALLVFLTQYTFRYLDDNRLTSWQWAFNGVAVERIFIYLVAGLFVACLLSIPSILEHRPVPSLMLITYAVSAFFFSEPEVIVDAARYFTQAKYLELSGIGYFLKEWGRNINAWTDMPLIPFLYGLVFRYIGESRLAIQLCTTSLFSLTVVLTYLIGRDLWNRETGIYGGLSLLGMPYLFTQVPLMLVDVPTMFFLTLSIFTYIRAVRSGKVWIILSSVSVVCTILSKYSTLLMLTIMAVISLIFFIEAGEHRGFLRGEVIRRSVMVCLATGVLTGLMVLARFDVIKAQIDLLLNYQRPALRGWSEGLVSTFLYQIHPFITIAAISSVYVAFRRRDQRYLIISWLILIVLFMHIRRIRYTLIVFPMFALMASYGLSALNHNGRGRMVKRLSSYIAVIFSIIIATTVYLPFLQRMAPVNLKDAGGFLNSKGIKAIRVITTTSGERILNQAVTVPILDIYFNGDIHYRQDEPPPPFERIRMSPLRFTWEYRVPDYYNNRVDAEALVVISNRPDALLAEPPSGVSKEVIDFQRSTGFFRYSPSVRIYY